MMTLKNIKNGVSNQRLNQFIVVLIMSGSAAYFKGVGFKNMNMQRLPAIRSADAKYPIQALTTDSV
jgi:predicted N-acetyltransferase YhbS